MSASKSGLRSEENQSDDTSRASRLPSETLHGAANIIRRFIPSIAVSVMLFSMPVLAQEGNSTGSGGSSAGGQASSAICDSGLGSLFQQAPNIIIGAALFVGVVAAVAAYIISSVVSNPQTEEKLKDITFSGGIKAPAFAVGLLYGVNIFFSNIVGWNLFQQCLSLPIVG